MINAEIQSDIVLNSFVPKVVPQPWMDPNPNSNLFSLVDTEVSFKDLEFISWLMIEMS